MFSLPRKIQETSYILQPEKTRKERRKLTVGDGRFMPKGEKNQAPKRRKRLFGKGNKDRWHR